MGKGTLEIHIHEHIWHPDKHEGELDYGWDFQQGVAILEATCEICQTRALFTKAEWEAMSPA